MFDNPTPHTRLHQFFQEHAEALQNSALLLGGQPWLRRTQRLISELSIPLPPTRRTRVEVEKFYGLLTLQFACDLDTPEAGFFAAIDPAQPEIEAVCLLTEGLEEAAADCGIMLDWTLCGADELGAGDFA